VAGRHRYGGTFTDVVAVQSSEVRTAKVPSTRPHFDDAPEIHLRPAPVSRNDPECSPAAAKMSPSPVQSITT
jgi:N-methylhydantoinase A/oxoprolinase/acetone carboxylase beta subunit